MTRLSGFAKALTVPALLGGGLLGVQAVVAAPPLASFDAPATAVCGQPVTFTDTSTDPDNDASTGLVEWDFDNNGSFEANGSPGTHTFATVGTHSVTMRKSDADTAGDGIETDTETKDVTVTSVAPVAAIGVSPTPTIGAPVSFSSAGSTDSDGIASAAWDLDNDGDYETPGLTASRTYADDGLKVVGLQVTDSCGVASPRKEAFFNVVNPAPTASFTIAPNPANPNQPVTFNAAASTGGGDTIETYQWDLDGDGVFNEGGATGETDAVQVTASYPASGPLNVTLVVTDQHGVTDDLVKQLRINSPPEPNFTFAPNPPLLGEQVTFQPTGSIDRDGTIALYEWDLDGNGSYEVSNTTGAPVTRAYGAAGEFNVGLRLTDNLGVKTAFQKPLQVQVTRPSAGLRYSPQNPVPGQAVTLTSTSAPAATPGAPALDRTEWDFAYPFTEEFSIDAVGGTATTSFATPGPKTVAVRITDAGGGFAIAKDTIVVNAPPQAAFAVNPAKPVEGQSVTFVSTAADPDGPLAAQQWDLDDDGQFDDAQGAVVSTSKLKKGSHTVRLLVTDAKGATAAAAQTVAVKAKPLKAPVDVKRSIGYAPRDWGVKLIVLIVKVPSKTTVTVACKGRGCPRGKLVKRSTKKAATLRFAKLHGSVRAGSKITLITTRPGHMIAYDTYLIRGKMRKPLLKEQCKLSPKGKPRRCPTS